MARRVVALLLLASLGALAPGVRAGEDAALFGGSYTAEELAALDRALHAANMTREDLRFRRDMTEGHECLDAVRAMLARPLLIAPMLDQRADRARTWTGSQGVSSLVLDLYPRYPQSTNDGYEPSLAGPSWADAGTPDTPDALFALIRSVFREEPLTQVDLFRDGALDLDELRHALPPSMAWHDVFESAFDEARTVELEAFLEAKKDAWIHEEASRIHLGCLANAWHEHFGVDPKTIVGLPTSAFPTDEPLVVDTAYGRIALGTPNDDIYTGDYTVLIDPGGNDRYEGCRIGAAYGTDYRRVAFFADLGGDDVYDCGDVNITLGAAVLGIAAFFDLGQGNDRYVGGHCSLGAAMGGIATFYDDGGTDTYEGKTYTQGAAGLAWGSSTTTRCKTSPR